MPVVVYDPQKKKNNQVSTCETYFLLFIYQTVLLMVGHCQECFPFGYLHFPR